MQPGEKYGTLCLMEIKGMNETINMAVPRLNVTISKEAKKKLDDYTLKENRSISNMVDTMILRYKEK